MAITPLNLLQPRPRLQPSDQGRVRIYNRTRRSLARRWRVQWQSWHRHQRGATTMEWAMLLMAIGIPAATISLVVVRLLGQYSKMTLTLTNLPFP